MAFNDYFAKWCGIISEKEAMKVMQEITPLYQKERVMPAYDNIFKAFICCPFDKLKVVIIGQDPYTITGVATGLAFASSPEFTPKSLNVIKEACIDYSVPHGHVKFDNTLESWASQGVLLLNAALTVGKESHLSIWRPFMIDLLKRMNFYLAPLVYVFLGKEASTFIPYISEDKNFILREKHPSYYARIRKPMPNIFKEINKILKDTFDEEIEWYSEQKD